MEGLLLVEMVVPGTASAGYLTFHMLVMTGGRERTQSEFCALLGATGHQLTKVITTMAPQSMIEAVAG